MSLAAAWSRGVRRGPGIAPLRGEREGLWEGRKGGETIAAALKNQVHDRNHNGFHFQGKEGGDQGKKKE